MYVFTDVDTYLNLLTGADNYLTLTLEEKEKLVFTAYELLSLHYSEPLLTPKIIAMQALYMADQSSAEGEEAAALKTIRAAGAKSYSLDGVSVSFDNDGGTLGISPVVSAILSKLTGGVYVGRLI